MTPERLPYLSADSLRRSLTWPQAVDALERSLHSHQSPGHTPPRAVIDVTSGQLLLMPAEVGADVGVKVATVRGNRARGDLPRIQGVYLLFDGRTMQPLALVDGVALTLLRTAAVSALAVRYLAEPGPARLVVFGSGPQAWAHVQSIAAVRALAEVVVVARTTHTANELVEQCRQAGLRAGRGESGAVREADLVACCTTAREPLFDSHLLRDHATVVAVGSHEPTAREVDTDLVRRATVVVETRGSALREAGDILLAMADGVDEPTAVAGEISDLVNGRVRLEPAHPRLFKSVGEAWGDLVLAATAVRAGIR